MGFNSVIFILNDELHRIEKDKDFGERVSEQLGLHVSGRHNDYPRHGFKAVAQHHADATSVIFVGGNMARVVDILNADHSWGHTDARGDDTVIEVLNEVARNYGYKLIRMSDKEKKKQSWRKPYRGGGFSH